MIIIHCQIPTYFSDFTDLFCQLKHALLMHIKNLTKTQTMTELSRVYYVLFLILSKPSVLETESRTLHSYTVINRLDSLP